MNIHEAFSKHMREEQAAHNKDGVISGVVCSWPSFVAALRWADAQGWIGHSSKCAEHYEAVLTRVAALEAENDELRARVAELEGKP